VATPNSRSRGFVIAALWHFYGTEVVTLPDGTVLRSNPAGGMNVIPPGEQQAKLERLGTVRAADQRFVLDQFAALKRIVRITGVQGRM